MLLAERARARADCVRLDDSHLFNNQFARLLNYDEFSRLAYMPSAQARARAHARVQTERRRFALAPHSREYGSASRHSHAHTRRASFAGERLTSAEADGVLRHIEFVNGKARIVDIAALVLNRA